jgi:peptide deformylase
VILKVLEVPDPRLKTPSVAVQPQDLAVQKLIDDMLETMNDHPRCVGLAAPQVGKSWRVLVIDASRVDKPGSRHGPLALLNARIMARTGQRLLREGCLSIPHYTGNVMRAETVKVQATDRDGKAMTIQAQGFEAVVLQHEIDHIDGLLFLDRVGSLETDVFRRKKYG